MQLLIRGQVHERLDLDSSSAAFLYDLAYVDHRARTFADSKFSMARLINQAKVGYVGHANL